MKIIPFPGLGSQDGLNTPEPSFGDEVDTPLPGHQTILSNAEADDAPADVTPLPIHRSELSDGKAGRHLHLLMPSPATPGFDLCSGRCFQVWLALVYHAERHGYWGCPDALPDDDRYQELKTIRADGLAAAWTVDLLAATCGVDPKTAGRALLELRDLRWLRYSVAKDRAGLFIGIVYVLTPPPTTLTSTATHRYRQQIEKKKEKLAEEEARLDRGQPDYQATDAEDAPDSFRTGMERE